MKNELSIEEIADYILEKDLINKNITIQVYEEIVHLGHFLNSLKPHNILEVGARGGTFLLFSSIAIARVHGVLVRVHGVHVYHGTMV